MHKYLPLIALLLLSACMPNTAEKTAEAVSSAETALWQGYYQGELPCPNCNYIALDITLSPPQRYHMTTEEVGHLKKTPKITKGTFHWRPDGLIQLDAAGDNMVFFIGKNGRMEMRDPNGQAHPNHRGEVCGLQKQASSDIRSSNTANGLGNATTATSSDAVIDSSEPSGSLKK